MVAESIFGFMYIYIYVYLFISIKIVSIVNFSKPPTRKPRHRVVSPDVIFFASDDTTCVVKCRDAPLSSSMLWVVPDEQLCLVGPGF